MPFHAVKLNSFLYENEHTLCCHLMKCIHAVRLLMNTVPNEVADLAGCRYCYTNVVLNI